jgi:hypothetical protein
VIWEDLLSRGRARADVARTRPAKMLEERMVIVLVGPRVDLMWCIGGCRVERLGQKSDLSLSDKERLLGLLLRKRKIVRSKDSSEILYNYLRYHSRPSPAAPSLPSPW